MRRVAVILCAVLSVAVAAEEVEIPKSLKVCSRQSQDYDGCLKDAIQDAIPKFAKGIPELDIPVLDPFVTEFQESEYGNGFMTGKITLKNVKTYGTSRARVLSVRTTATEDRHRLEIDLGFPKIFIEGEYKAEGRLNDFKLGGKGYFNVSMEGVTTVFDVTGRIENDRWVVEHVTSLPEVEKMKIYFDDLFNGNENINNVARSFVNEYWPLFYRELLPVTAAAWDEQLTEFMNRPFSKLSYSKLFA